MQRVKSEGRPVRPNRIVAYRYLTDEPDPDLNFCRDLLATTRESFREVAAKSGLSVGTLVRIDREEVWRPQNLTVNKLAEAFGYRRVWEKEA